MDKPKARARELAKFDSNRRERKNLNALRDGNEGKYRGGEGKTPVTTASDLSRRSLRVKISYELSWRVKAIIGLADGPS